MRWGWSLSSWEGGGNSRPRVWEPRQDAVAVFFKVWPAGHLHQTHLGELVPMQIPRPTLNEAGTQEGSLGGWLPQMILGCAKL